MAAAASTENDRPHFLLLPGLSLGNFFSKAPEFRGLIQDLKAESFEFSLLGARGNPLPDQSAKQIVHLVREVEGPIVIVSYSRGSLDALEAIRQMDTEERQKIQLWIALQSFFGGSPLFNDIGQKPDALHQGAKFVLSALGVSRALVTELSSSHRETELDRARQDLQALVESIPIHIHMGSHGDRKLAWGYRWLWRVFARQHLPLLKETDGILHREAMRLPHSSSIGGPLEFHWPNLSHHDFSAIPKLVQLSCSKALSMKGLR
ncbi:MAG: hypothetical protein EA369_00365 [Bradymonadales bacterium]|nr:MAG: hypothetical protein EA369_00365 [Bradymonadales bacterium]